MAEPEEVDEDAEVACPGCDLPQSQWIGAGAIGKSGELYCCVDCAEGKICSCNPARKAEVQAAS